MNRKWFTSLLWAAGGFLSIIVSYEELRKAFVKFGDPAKWSDVLPQVQILFDRFANGIFPYQPIDLGYTLHPIYMPLQWLPVGLGAMLQVDPRWIGFGAFALAVAVYGWFLSTVNGNVWIRILALLMPSLVLWSYILFGGTDLVVSFEMITGAYYLLLATGLLLRKLWLVALGIIACLLARYTLVFWLPLFGLMLFFEFGWKKSFIVWGVIVTSFALLYIIPFYIKDPEMLKRGVSHYETATVLEWKGYGDPPVSYSLEHGISFNVWMKRLFHGEMDKRVQSARILQLSFLILAMILVLLAYKRWRSTMDFYTINLIALYCILLCYYLFAPLLYRYYLFSFLSVSSALCCTMVLLRPKQMTFEK